MYTTLLHTCDCLCEKPAMFKSSSLVIYYLIFNIKQGKLKVLACESCSVQIKYLIVFIIINGSMEDSVLATYITIRSNYRIAGYFQGGKFSRIGLNSRIFSP